MLTHRSSCCDRQAQCLCARIGVAGLLLIGVVVAIPIVDPDVRANDDDKADQSESADRQYRPGYDAEKTPRKYLRGLPEPAWGPEIKGLQAGLVAPKSIRMNEVTTFYLVVRNVSDRTIRVSVPERPVLVNIQPGESTLSYTMSGGGGALVAWELKPGHQVDIASPPVQALAAGDFGLRKALTALRPGPHRLTAWTGAYGKGWVLNEDGTRREIVTPKDEWRGKLAAAKRMMEIVPDKAPFKVTELTGLPGLPDDHGLSHVVGRPPTLNQGRVEWIALRDGLDFAFDCSHDEHWLLDGRYSIAVFWGPIPAGRLQELGLLDRFVRLSREHILADTYPSEKDERVANLISCEQPLAGIGLDFVSLLKLPNPTERIPTDYVARTIRDRRVTLTAMGLAKPMQKALEHLTANDPPLPDDSQFRVIADDTLPAGLPEDAWGPKNDGLQAAALMPDAIAEGETKPVRLLIRNVSDRDIRLAVSERTGYDYARAVDLDDNKVPSIRPLVYPTFFASVIMPEINPGQNTQRPPTATLKMILLRPGAAFELTTPTALSYHSPENANESYKRMTPTKEQPAVTHINSKPGDVVVTWHLHTANGASHSYDLKRRLWPARGSWSGLLTTAPVQITLAP